MKITLPGVRWWIATALFFAAVLNYIDRSVLGILAPTIQKDLAISEQQYATVITFFMVAYAIAYFVSGRIVDRLGVKLSLFLFVTWWSISNALTGMAKSVRSLCWYRFSLGLGEAGGFTASPKAVSEWFPPEERGLAVGIFSVGGAIGGTLAPIIVGHITLTHHWRWVFIFTSLLSLPWLLFWFWIYHKPSVHPHLSEAERNYLSRNLPAAVQNETEDSSPKESWLIILREPFVWRILVARLMTDAVSYFYPFWMPKYLHSVRGLDQQGLSIMWIVALGGDIGCIGGGFLSGFLIKRGLMPASARLKIMICSACLVPISFLIPYVGTTNAVIAIAMVVSLANAAWLTNVSSLVVDLAPKKLLGTAFGLIACGSALGGIIMNQSVAWLISHRSYDDCFYIMAFLHPTALLLLWRLGKKSPSRPV